MKPQMEAIRNHGCDQVLWLIGDDHRVTESGAMNFFVYWKNNQGENELITAPLDGTILEVKIFHNKHLFFKLGFF